MSLLPAIGLALIKAYAASSFLSVIELASYMDMHPHCREISLVAVLVCWLTFTQLGTGALILCNIYIVSPAL